MGYDIHTPEHIVTFILISFPVPFRLSDVIREYGEPGHLVARRRDNIEARETGRLIYDLHFIYLPYGFVLSEEGLHSKPSFSGGEVFKTLILFPPTPQGFSDATGISPEFLSSWQGFKNFDFYCRDERTFNSCD